MAGSKPAALPLGDTPAEFSASLDLRPILLQPIVHRRAVQAPGHETVPALRYLLRDVARVLLALEAREKTRTGSRQTRTTTPIDCPQALVEPIQRSRYLGIASTHHRLADIAGLAWR